MDITTLVEGRYLNPHVVCCVLSMDAFTDKHCVNKWQEQGLVIDVCQGQKPRSAVVFLSNLVLITSVSAETIKDRMNAKSEI